MSAIRCERVKSKEDNTRTIRYKRVRSKNSTSVNYLCVFRLLSVSLSVSLSLVSVSLTDRPTTCGSVANHLMLEGNASENETMLKPKAARPESSASKSTRVPAPVNGVTEAEEGC